MADRPRRRPPWAWRFVLSLALFGLRRLYGWRVYPRPPLRRPGPDEPLVVVFNHTSNVDAFLVAGIVWRGLGRWCRPLAKEELFTSRVVGPFARRAGAIPVARGEGDGREAAFRGAIDALRGGDTVLVAPEGTISHDGTLLPLRYGAARMALASGAQVLVVTHFGAQRGASPAVRGFQRGVPVTMTMDLLEPWPDEDAASLTGRIAATFLDRSAELQAAYPDADPEADWWPPYATATSPSATARESLERYQASMAETIAAARERMARMAEEHDLEQRLADARTRAEELAHDARHRAEDLATTARERMDDLTAQARDRVDGLTHPRRAADDASPHDAATDPRPDGRSQQ